METPETAERLTANQYAQTANKSKMTKNALDVAINSSRSTRKLVGQGQKVVKNGDELT